MRPSAARPVTPLRPIPPPWVEPRQLATPTPDLDGWIIWIDAAACGHRIWLNGQEVTDVVAATASDGTDQVAACRRAKVGDGLTLMLYERPIRVLGDGEVAHRYVTATVQDVV